MDNEMNLKSAYDSLQKKELEQRKTIKQMSERIKELEAIVSKNESLHLVSQRYTIEDIERCVENWGLCKVEKEYIERFLNGG